MNLSHLRLSVQKFARKLIADKFVGVYLDAELTFKKHIEHVRKNLNEFCGIV